MKTRLMLLLLALWLPAVAMSEPEFHIPEGSNLRLLPQENIDGYFVFEGQTTLTGLLRVRWAGEFDDRYLYLDFMPDADGQKKLPYALDGYNEAEKTLVLNEDESGAEQMIMVNMLFQPISQHFWRFQEGELEGAVQLTVASIQVNGECDHRHYYADVAAYQKSPATAAVFTGDSSEPFGLTIIFIVAAQDGYANLRARPSMGAKVLLKLLNDDVLVKVNTVDERWFLVETPSGLQGYIHRSQIRPGN